ncbi:MAG: ester cyclase, partial [Ginsengibacter sp.]
MKVMNLKTVIALLFLLSCNSPQEDAFRDKQANEAAQRAKIENTCEECWNKKNMEKFREISTENFVRNVNDIRVANNEKEMEAAFNVFFTGFPDLHISLHDITVKDTHAFAH